MDIQIDNLDLSSQQKENLRLNLKDILEEKISLDSSQELRDNLSKLTVHPASSFEYIPIMSDQMLLLGQMDPTG